MDNRPSIFSSALRAFFVTVFVMAGVLVGLILMIMVIGAISSTAAETSSPTYTFKTLPDAEGNTTTLASSTPVLLQLDIHGVIGNGHLTTEKIRTLLAESRGGVLKSDRVKGILLHIDSPGGTIEDAQGIFLAIKEYKDRYKVPVYAYTPGLCASGGMYIAAISDKIYANDVALIGSVGVILSSFLNFTQLMEKVGVQALTLAAGKDKDAMNPLRPWVSGEDAQYRNLLNHYYDYFVNLIVTHRPISKEKLVNEYGAQVFPAPQAKEYGYIDETENDINKVLTQLQKAAGLEDQSYQVMHAEEKSWVSELFNTRSALFSGKVTHTVELPIEYDPAFRGHFFYLYRG